MNGFAARLRGWIWQMAWLITGVRRLPRAPQLMEPADMGTAFGLDFSYDDQALRPSPLARERSLCRPTSAFIPATVRARRARG
jgi:hypothetical protein